MPDRIWNFGAGPAALPEPVLRVAQHDTWNIADSGIGIAEHSHRGKVFDKVIKEAEGACRDLAGIGDDYSVLFLQGGASLQFAMVPMNYLPAGRSADYLVTGVWSQKAVAEAQKLGSVHEAVSAEATRFDRIPPVSDIRYSENPVYVHFTTNNTIYGTQWNTEPPSPSGVPLIADASSDIFSRPIDVSKYSLIYAGAQKNLGPSGVVLVIMKKSLIESGASSIPAILQYRTHAKEPSLYNTPNTFGIYLMGEVFKWIKSEGGLKGMAERNEAKGKLLYDALEQSTMFRIRAQPGSRSRMNVVFLGPDEATENRFVAEATKRGLDGLKGHRSAGGLRASIYNAMPLTGVQALVDFIREFERTNG